MQYFATLAGGTGVEDQVLEVRRPEAGGRGAEAAGLGGRMGALRRPAGHGTLEAHGRQCRGAKGWDDSTCGR
mgnify:CR=1 FL=1